MSLKKYLRNTIKTSSIGAVVSGLVDPVGGAIIGGLYGAYENWHDRKNQKSNANNIAHAERDRMAKELAARQAAQKRVMDTRDELRQRLSLYRTDRPLYAEATRQSDK